jgi:hypothetical protein
MINRKTMLASGIAAAIFAASTAGAAPISTSTSVFVQPVFNVPNGSTVLYDQTDNLTTNGTTAQNFSSSYDSYDNEAADDFVVPAGGWTISSVNLATTTNPGFLGATTVTVNVYPDATGIPAVAPVCSYSSAAAVVAAASTAITLPTGCSLGAGNYWLGISVNLDFTPNGQIFWTTRAVGSFADAVWRNPGDAFATGCTDWGTLPTCGVGGGVDPALGFQIVGAVGGGGIPLEPARELPTLSQWSALLAASGLALIGMLGLRRRSRR